MNRVAEVRRDTKETQIRVRVDLDGTGKATLATGIGFFDHMLDQIARHGLIDLEVAAKGDLHIDAHRCRGLHRREEHGPQDAHSPHWTPRGERRKAQALVQTQREDVGAHRDRGDRR